MLIGNNYFVQNAVQDRLKGFQEVHYSRHFYFGCQLKDIFVINVYINFIPYS